MYGFTNGMFGMTVMPWQVPGPAAGTQRSDYDRAKEKATPGYHGVYSLTDFKAQVEMTVTERTGIYRFTYPEVSCRTS